MTRLPPSVPRLRVWTAPIVWAASTRAGTVSRMIGDCMISVCVTSAPMLSPSFVIEMCFNSSSARDIDDDVGSVSRWGKLEVGEQIGSPGQHLHFGGRRPLREKRHRVARIARRYEIECFHAFPEPGDFRVSWPCSLAGRTDLKSCSSAARTCNRGPHIGGRIREPDLTARGRPTHWESAR